ncbi:DUF4198 domain-containing protein [Pseudoduganella sp. RAF53_2]|uniref:DUF4198 domain-containing protein n=1 Tax=Pseudoduganella sp. RAF53_2 TaxID=3233060 RepID=UPI003F9A83DC
MASKYAAALCMALLPAAAPAHDFWIQPASYHLRAGEAVSLSLEVGHGEDRQRSPIPARRIIRFTAVAPDGDTQPVQAGLRLAAAGTHVLLLQTDDKAQSFVPVARFNAYLYTEGLQDVITHRERNKLNGEDGAERYSRVAKALISVGDARRGAASTDAATSGPTEAALSGGAVVAETGGTDGGAATRVYGLPLEIVPERDPAGATAVVPVRVLYRGMPLEGGLVKLTYLAHDAEPVAEQRTDQNGRVAFAVPPCGAWLLSVVWSEPAPPGDGTDYDTIFSSLSFARGVNCQTSASTVAMPMDDSTSQGNAGMPMARARSIR